MAFISDLEFDSADIKAAFRSGISMLMPLLVLYEFNALDLSAYVTLAAFTSLYGRNEAYRQRITTVSIAGLVLVIVISTGAVAAAFDWPEAARLAILLIITAGGVVLSYVMRWIPYGPVFYVFAFSVCATIPTTPAQLPLRIGLATAAAAFSWILCMFGWLVRRWAPYTARRLRTLTLSRREPGDLAGPMVYGVALETTVALAVALWIASLTPLGHGYWAAVTVAAVLPGPYAPYAFTRIVHRVLGTAAGVVVTGAFFALQPSLLVVILAIGVCQFGAKIFVPKIYWVGLVFITPAALSIRQLSAPTSTESLLTDRLFQTLIGGIVAAAVVGLVKVASRRRPAI